MSSPFRRTLRSLEADSPRRLVPAFLLLGVLAVLWCAWFGFARVKVYRTTNRARFEVNLAAHPVEPSVAGRVLSSRLELGREIEAGDVLLELESDTQRLQLGQEQARLAATTAQLVALQREIAAEEQALQNELDTAHSAVAAAKAKGRVASTAARYGSTEAAITQKLRESSLVTGLDALHTTAEAQKQLQEAEALRLDAKRVESSSRTLASDRVVQIERLKRDVAVLEGQIATSKATINLLQYEINRRVIRASIGGKLAEVSRLPIGSYVTEGQRVAAIVPAGEIRAVAEFLPAEALGRIRAGQPARLRLDGFSWVQYGSVSATVSHVASEPREGRIWVELRVDPNPRIPFEHGLTGSVEVEVERVRPVTLVLRSIGQQLAGPVESPAGSAPVRTEQSPPHTN